MPLSNHANPGEGFWGFGGGVFLPFLALSSLICKIHRVSLGGFYGMREKKDKGF